MSISSDKSNYLLSAGEQSGDLIGAGFANAMMAASRLQPFGIAGPAMRSAGVEAIGGIEELSVMGVFDVLRKVSSICQIERKILNEIDRKKPKFAVLIDFPGFHLRLAEQLRLRQVPTIQLVAPKVWAWGGHRIEKIRNTIQMVLGILPFEEEFFRSRGVNFEYIGFPSFERLDKVMVSKADFNIDPGRPVFAMLPGSRISEIKRILPTMFIVKDLLSAKYPNAKFVLPIAESLDWDSMMKSLEVRAKSKPLKENDFLVSSSRRQDILDGVHFVHGMSLEVMKLADCALVASGTATLECAVLGTPFAAVYKMDEFSYGIAEKVVKVPYVSLVNLILNCEVVKEYIQEFSPVDVADTLSALFEDDSARGQMLQKFKELKPLIERDSFGHAAQLVVENFA